MAAKSTKRGKTKTAGTSRVKNLTTRTAGEVKGDALQTYVGEVTAEKQGTYTGH